MKSKKANESSVYEALNVIDGSFRQILQELKRLQQLDSFRERASIKSVELSVKETRAWTLFEVLDVLHEHEEGEWNRLGRTSKRREGSRSGSRPRSTTK